MSGTQTFSALKSEQREAIGLLQVGTFLEYFDLMLYLHMSILLNALFFPPTDPHTARLLVALSFCTTFVLRPFGALLFGYIGDHIGRKVTVVITTLLMSITCLTMFALPTYAQIGIAATWVMLACRALQGVSSMGEIIGAELYLTESIERPAVYPAVGLLSVSITLGAVAALGVASLATSYGFNWRYAFLVGAGIAMIGAIARTRLRETPEFVNAKHYLNTVFKQVKLDRSELATNSLYQDYASKTLLAAYFFIQCAYPVFFYIVYGYCGLVLKDTFHCTAAQIIHQNLGVSVIRLIVVLGLTFLSYKICPLKLLRVQLVMIASCALLCPYLLAHISTPWELFLIQAAIITCTVGDFPAGPIFYRYFPIFKRFTYAGLIFAGSHALMFVVTAFGSVYLTDYFGHYGLLIITLPVLLGYAFGLHYFVQLEKRPVAIPDKKTF